MYLYFAPFLFSITNFRLLQVTIVTKANSIDKQILLQVTIITPGYYSLIKCTIIPNFANFTNTVTNACRVKSGW